MYNVEFKFAYPWLFLLLIPMLAVALFFHFRIAKKYRRTRNRIISLTLHIIVCILSVFVLTGFTINYQKPNDANEIMIVLDLSKSEDDVKDERDEFIHTLINRCKLDDYKVGLVTFGFNQNYNIPLTNKLDDFYNKYLQVVNNTDNSVDTSATNIADAITFAKNQITHPETSKIVLVTDGKETDLNASSQIRSLVSQGILMDTVYLSSENTKSDVEILGVVFPDMHIKQGVTYQIGLNVYLTNDCTMSLVLYDNGQIDESTFDILSVGKGEQTIYVDHSFGSDGLHEVSFEIAGTEDSVEENNRYSSYCNIEEYNKVLVVERKKNESSDFITFFNSDDKYNVTVASVNDVDDNHILLPTTIEGLLAYDQVVLDNISDSDINTGFDALLYSYVYDYGGGLFVTGGTEDDGSTPHAYNQSDMKQSQIYQSMLPVQVINYTPPVGLMILVDTSGSMGVGIDGETNQASIKQSRLDAAIQGAWTCVKTLSDRDYIGVISFGTDAVVELEMVERTKESYIRQKLVGIELSNGETIYGNAISLAGDKLKDTRAKKKHIIIVTDGAPTDTGIYEKYIEENAKNGITLSIVNIDPKANAVVDANMSAAAELGGGKYYRISGKDISTQMREDLFKVVKIHEVNEEEFIPVAYQSSSVVYEGINLATYTDLETKYGSTETQQMTESVLGKYLPAKLGGFYGSKIKSDSELILTAQYDAPVYSQWKFGNGMVGCFMCDLNNSSWSSSFMQEETSVTFIRNIIETLMPTTNIRPNEITATIKEYNYINQLSIYTSLDSDQKIVGTIKQVGASEGQEISLNEISSGENISVTSELSISNNYSRCTFVAKDCGVYLITFKKVDSQGTVLEEKSIYKAFGFSKEYSNIEESTTQELQDNLLSLAQKTGGTMVEDLEDPYEIFMTFDVDVDKVYDPRYLFIIICIVLFLTDIAVRKFKFKWIHEIIRDKKQVDHLQK